MVVRRLKVQFESELEADGTVLKQVNVEHWTNERRAQAVKTQLWLSRHRLLKMLDMRHSLSSELLIQQGVLLP